MNKIIVTGRLTKDGELRTTQSNDKVYSNSIAVKRNYKNSAGEYDVDFFNFNYWHVSEKLIDYLTKGRMVVIEGRLQNRSYETNNGEKKYITEIVVERMELAGDGKKEKDSSETSLEDVGVPSNYTTNYQEKEIHLTDEDLPF